MRAGLLRHSLTIQSKSESRTDHGEMTDSWSTFATVWGSVNPISSKEGYEADQAVPRRTHEIVIRYLDGLTADMRVLYDSRYFYLTGPPRDFQERGIYMALDCDEKVA